MEQVKVSTDWEKWQSKPNPDKQYDGQVDKYGNIRTETRVLGSRLGCVVESLNPVLLAELITSGRTWSPFTFNTCPSWGRRRRIEDLFEQCQILAVDFDDGRTVEEITQAAAALGLTFTILHHSFSSTPEHTKLRGIFFLDEKIDDFALAKTYSTGLAYALGGDRVCVDVARMYFGSTANSVVIINPEQTTSLELVKKITSTQSIPRPVQQSKLSVPKDVGWGSPEEQQRLFDGLTKSKKAFIRAKVNAILLEVQNFVQGQGKSRYECVWRNTSRLARMPELTGYQVHLWVAYSVSINDAFADWDKDPDKVIMSAIDWSNKHADEPL
jgi:hypothetical protein